MSTDNNTFPKAYIPQPTGNMQTGLPDAGDLGLMLSLRRQGIQTSWEHNDLLDVLTGVRPGVDTEEDMSKWAFMRTDGSLGPWTPPKSEHEGALLNAVREHDEASASDTIRAQTHTQDQAQSMADLDAIAAAPQAVPSAPILGDLAQEAQGRQMALRKAKGAPGRPEGIAGLSRMPGILDRARWASRGMLPMLRGR